MFSHHEHNEEQSVERILSLLEEGKAVGICTDAGTPAISDPGYRAVSKAIERGFGVETIPGPCAATTALVASGLPSSSYTFKGYPPRKKGPRTTFLALDAHAPHTLIFYESARRVAGFLKEAAGIYGDRKAAVCIEMTKKYERTLRGFLTDLAGTLEGKKVKGEVTVVIAGDHPKFIRNEG